MIQPFLFYTFSVKAAAVVFGLGGFFVGKPAEKKKKLAVAEGTENKEDEE